MLRIGQVEATATQDGKYTDGSVAGGIAATRLRAAAFNAMQEELAHIVESAGLALDINDMTQVLKAIQKLTLSRANPFADIKSDGAAAISTALTNLGFSEYIKGLIGQGDQWDAWKYLTFFAGLKGDAGYQYFPNGMLLQWGTVTLKAAPSGTSIGTFPVAFPAAGQQIFVTHDNPLANVMAFGAAQIINTTQFRVNAVAINTDTFTMSPGFDLTLRWFAIGS